MTTPPPSCLPDIINAPINVDSCLPGIINAPVDVDSCIPGTINAPVDIDSYLRWTITAPVAIDIYTAISSTSASVSCSVRASCSNSDAVMTFISSSSDSEDVASGAVIPLENYSRLLVAGMKKAFPSYMGELVAIRANSQCESCRTDHHTQLQPIFGCLALTDEHIAMNVSAVVKSADSVAVFKKWLELFYWCDLHFRYYEDEKRHAMLEWLCRYLASFSRYLL